jgi:hypothetical protein
MRRLDPKAVRLYRFRPRGLSSEILVRGRLLSEAAQAANRHAGGPVAFLGLDPFGGSPDIDLILGAKLAPSGAAP